MRASVRRLEHFLICQLLRVSLEPIVDDYLQQWQRAMDERETLPDPLELAQTAADNGIPILAFAPLDAYLNRCADDWRLPDAERIVTAIVHGHAEVRFMIDKTCRCPARRNLCAVPTPAGRDDFFDWATLATPVDAPESTV